MKQTKIIITSEHYTNYVPQEYMHLFKGNEDILTKHHAYDIGSNYLAQGIANITELKLFHTTVSRLLIDCNRNTHHPKLFSRFTKGLDMATKHKLIEEYYLSYRNIVENHIVNLINDNFQVLHLSIHTFTPKLHNILRQSDIGLLYDPRCHGEKEVARVLKNFILSENHKYILRLNYPYKGQADGFTTTLRKKHTQSDYLGIEIECNQSLTQNEETLNPLMLTLGKSINELKFYL